MTREELIRNLKYTMEKHKNIKVYSFETNIYLLCKDVLDYLEQDPKNNEKVTKLLNILISKLDNDKPNIWGFALISLTPIEIGLIRSLYEEIHHEG